MRYENFAIAEKISIFQEHGSQKYAKDCQNFAGGRNPLYFIKNAGAALVKTITSSYNCVRFSRLNNFKTKTLWNVKLCFVCWNTEVNLTLTNVSSQDIFNLFLLETTFDDKLIISINGTTEEWNKKIMNTLRVIFCMNWIYKGTRNRPVWGYTVGSWGRWKLPPG